MLKQNVINLIINLQSPHLTILWNYPEIIISVVLHSLANVLHSPEKLCVCSQSFRYGNVRKESYISVLLQVNKVCWNATLLRENANAEEHNFVREPKHLKYNFSSHLIPLRVV